ncbi:class I SAM-dependent methyltransferase [Rubrimonas cliftonensis]|uniref:Methyltransferase domain-containing protein n=1 Tax=Rubrimonas cliftonensis TaxID=89524 RepID=A0A1H3ZCW2_9RHOB|nr:class I SAM-dependent methyltransferase [Rubrimonas cliftonensis]SEA21639.1 Methyltransferase domain-containing protein [Rubrimonas cliftonensis]
MSDGADAPSTPIRDVLNIPNAFDGLQLDPARVDEQGWNSRHPFFDTVIELCRPRLVIELGVWKGMSALYMADVMERLGVDGEILAIDTWLGSSEHLLQERWRASLRHEHGMPTIYRTFLANVMKRGHQNRITPLPMDGASAAVVLQKLGVKAQVIHIDGSHEYAACLADLRAYWSLLDAKGVLIVDDYARWPEVTKATCQFAAEVNRAVFGGTPKALIARNPKLFFDFTAVARIEGR